MNDEQIIKLISEIVMTIDYDIWKHLFDENCIEDLEDAADIRDDLVLIVKKYLNE